jgi:hypothetical protein
MRTRIFLGSYTTFFGASSVNGGFVFGHCGASLFQLISNPRLPATASEGFLFVASFSFSREVLL